MARVEPRRPIVLDRTVVEAKVGPRPEPMATDRISQAEARSLWIVGSLAFWAAAITLAVML